MHVSLDSALGRQRRLNSVGESVLQIAPNAAAAYSLRSLTGGDPAVVRVRRGGDNSEQDFTASQISAGALTSFVNEAGFRFNLEEAATDGSFADGPTNQIYASNADNTVWTGETTSSHTFQYTGSAWFYRYTDSATGNIYQVTANADSTHPYNANWFSSTVTTSTYNTGSYYGQSANLFSDVGYFSFSSPGDGFVETWYDQSGNGKDAIQETSSKQPKIVSAGVLESDGLKFDGSNDLLDIGGTGDNPLGIQTADPLSIYTVQIPEVSSILGDNSNRQLRFETNSVRYYLSTNPIGANQFSASATELSLFSTNHAGVGTESNMQAHVNGAATVTVGSNVGTSGANTAASCIEYIGANIGTSYQQYYGESVQEIIIYKSDQTANRTAIETNINGHYSIF